MIHVPEELARSQAKYNGEAGRAFVAGLPDLAEDFLGRWGLRVTGPSMYGMASLVLPVERVADRTRAALKMQILDEETEGEPIGLRAWDGAGFGTAPRPRRRHGHDAPGAARRGPAADVRHRHPGGAGHRRRAARPTGGGPGAGRTAGARRHRGRDARGGPGGDGTPRRGGRGGAAGLRGRGTGCGGRTRRPAAPLGPAPGERHGGRTRTVAGDRPETAGGRPGLRAARRP